MVRFRHYDGFTGLSADQRRAHAQQLIEMYSSRLQSGWSPFTDSSQAIYTDNIDYKTVADMYGKRRGMNNTIRPLVSRFLDVISGGVRHSTYLTYKSKLRIFVLWSEVKGYAENDIATYDNQLIGLFFWYLIDTRKLSSVSILKYTELLTTFFTFLKKEKLIILNPVYDLPVCNRINDQAPRPIMRSDLEVFKAEIRKDPELWLAVMFEYYCALRPGHEIREMKIKDLDLIAGTVHISRSRAKNNIDSVVTIPLQLLEELRGFYKLSTYDKEFYVFGKGGSPGSACIGKNKLNYKFNKIRKALNMPSEYKLYSFKHTAAVELDENSIPAIDISRHYRHSSLSITNEYLKNKKTGVSRAIRNNYTTL
jgi:integrase